MAKKNGLGLYKIAGACAFISLTISGVSLLLAALIGGSLGILALVGQICLVASTIITAGLFVNSSAFPWKSKFWVILYYVVAIIAIVNFFL